MHAEYMQCETQLDNYIFNTHTKKNILKDAYRDCFFIPALGKEDYCLKRQFKEIGCCKEPSGLLFVT